ncbi:hypothetical protein [Actinoplanes sp. NPDC051851]|uniref:hypothetical protein n=1 Tax=Actinoplanes sp. NPDC051851 TaxID=3154753 RepID=UPI003445FE5E
MDRAFLLLKPDCLRLGLGAEVEAVARAHGLTVRCRHRRTLTPDDLRFLWTEYTDEEHVLTRALLDRYLCEGPSEVWHLTGPDAFAATRKIKRKVRGRYARGPFANLVHAAEQPAELTRQGNRLLDECSAWEGDPEDGQHARRPGGIDFRRHADVDAAIDRLWPMLRVDETPAPPPVRLDDGSGAVYLGPDPAHSLDSAVTALWRALPGIDLGHAILLNTFAAKTGGYPIAVGARASVLRCHEALLRAGLQHCWTGVQ